MNDDVFAELLPALDIAAFERRADGSFRALSPSPPWFTRLGRDGTFPFLGHILEEANALWATNLRGSQEWGPCVEVDEEGQEFHYKVRAFNLEAHACLVFQLDETAERMREILQKVRSDALNREQDRGD